MLASTQETDALVKELDNKVCFIEADEAASQLSDFACKLERERDEARASVDEMKEWCKSQRHLYDLAISNQESWMRKWDASQAELTQLSKVCDELAITTRAGMGTHGEPCAYGDKCTLIVSCKEALTKYSTLPHVIKAKGTTKFQTIVIPRTIESFADKVFLERAQLDLDFRHFFFWPCARASRVLTYQDSRLFCVVNTVKMP